MVPVDLFVTLGRVIVIKAVHNKQQYHHHITHAEYCKHQYERTHVIYGKCDNYNYYIDVLTSSDIRDILASSLTIIIKLNSTKQLGL